MRKMRKITIIIETGNSAFNPDPRFEVARILKELSSRILEEAGDGDDVITDLDMLKLFDVNGNDVGQLRAE